MKKELLKLLTIALTGILSVGCSDDNTPEPAPAATIEITTQVPENGPVLLVPGNTYKIEFKAENAQTITANPAEGWQVDINRADGYAEITAPAADAPGSNQYKMTLTAQGGEAATPAATVWFYCVKDFSDPKGAFVLNEGNMTSENGSLIYITPEGYVLDNAYKAVNGTELGNVCQDMWFCGGKIYIISQNGDKNPVGSEFENDGMLVIADAKTLKKMKAYTKEDLGGLTWPSHIGVLDEEHVYIRDNGSADGSTGNGKIWRLNTKTGELKALEGSQGAPKAPFEQIGDKLYTYYLKPGTYLTTAYLWEVSTSADKIETKQLPYAVEDIYGIEADRDSLLVMFQNSSKKTIVWKADPSIAKHIQYGHPYKEIYYELPEDDGSSPSSQTGKSSGKVMAVHNNIVYYLAPDETIIYKVDFNSGPDGAIEYPNGTSESQEEELIDLYDLDQTALMMYNGINVNPATGILYANSIKGYGNFFTTNSIWGFDTNGLWENCLYKFDNYTHFPAGIFFPPVNNTDNE